MRTGLPYRIYVRGFHGIAVALLGLGAGGLLLLAHVPGSVVGPVMGLLAVLAVACAVASFVAGMVGAITDGAQRRTTFDPIGQRQFTKMFFADLIHPFTWTKR
jgi:hypothetical protein